MPRHLFSIGVTVAGWGFAASFPAFAQATRTVVGPGMALEDSVISRDRPGYGPIGIALGAFRLYPSVETRASYDSNLYALPNAPVEDVALLLAPRLALTSIENRRYLLSLVADGMITRYADQRIENNESGGVTASGRLEVDRDTQVSTSLTAARRIQRRGTEDESVIGIASPVAYREFTAMVGGERRFGPIAVRVGGDASEYRYEAMTINGVPRALNDNDFEQFGLNARMAVAVGPAIGAFVAASANQSRYAAATRLPGRDSAGYALLGGVAFATPLLTGEVGLGYISQRFDSPAYGDIRGVNYAVKVNWTPTRLVDVHLNVGRAFQRSALLGAAGIRLDSASITADYELLRNLLLNAGLSYTISDYRGLDRRERRLDGVFGIRYLANANLSLVATFSAAQQHRATGSALGRDYDRARVSAGIRLHL